MKPLEERWCERADTILASKEFDVRAASMLVCQIADECTGQSLAQAARQALPILRGAATQSAGAFSRAAARHRFEAFRREMKGGPTFGRREQAGAMPFRSGDGEHRVVLGLPASGPLTSQDVRLAFRRTAKDSHPDVGGCATAFLKIIAARNALLAAAEQPG